MSKNIIDTSKKLTDSPSFRRLIELSEKYSKILPKYIPDDSEWNNSNGSETPDLESESNETKNRQLEYLEKIVKHLDVVSKKQEKVDKQQKRDRLLNILGLILNIIFFTVSLLI